MGLAHHRDYRHSTRRPNGFGSQPSSESILPIFRYCGEDVCETRHLGEVVLLCVFVPDDA